MQIRKLLTDDEAVSPVIGVILMVAITVILAAVIGTFVLGLQDRVGQAAPNAAFSWEFNDQGDGWGTNPDYVNITHDGGDELTAADIDVQIDNLTVSAQGTWSSDGISAGQTVSISDTGSSADVHLPTETGISDPDATDIQEGDNIRVIWNNPEGSKTQTIGQNEVS